MKKILAVIAALLFVSPLLAPTTADARRPDLATARYVGAKASDWMCNNLIFPIDPYENRCRTSGIELDPANPRYRRTCLNDTSWCFDKSWSTNNSLVVKWYRIRVAYRCATCVELRTFYSNLRDQM
jgi:hypothetical protein